MLNAIVLTSLFWEQISLIFGIAFSKSQKLHHQLSRMMTIKKKLTKVNRQQMRKLGLRVPPYKNRPQQSAPFSSLELVAIELNKESFSNSRGNFFQILYKNVSILNWPLYKIWKILSQRPTQFSGLISNNIYDGSYEMYDIAQIVGAAQESAAVDSHFEEESFDNGEDVHAKEVGLAPLYDGTSAVNGGSQRQSCYFGLESDIFKSRRGIKIIDNYCRFIERGPRSLTMRSKLTRVSKRIQKIVRRIDRQLRKKRFFYEELPRIIEETASFNSRT